MNNTSRYKTSKKRRLRVARARKRALGHNRCGDRWRRLALKVQMTSRLRSRGGGSFCSHFLSSRLRSLSTTTIVQCWRRDFRRSPVLHFVVFNACFRRSSSWCRPRSRTNGERRRKATQKMWLFSASMSVDCRAWPRAKIGHTRCRRGSPQHLATKSSSSGDGERPACMTRRFLLLLPLVAAAAIVS